MGTPKNWPEPGKRIRPLLATAAPVSASHTIAPEPTTTLRHKRHTSILQVTTLKREAQRVAHRITPVTATRATRARVCCLERGTAR